MKTLSFVKQIKIMCVCLSSLLIFGCTNETIVQKNKTLLEENIKLTTEIDTLKDTNAEILKENDKYKTEIPSIEEELADNKKEIEKLHDNNSSLKDTISELQEKNESLQSEIELSYTGSAGNLYEEDEDYFEEDADYQSMNVEEEESFDNCTELTATYPHGVAFDHPAYQDKMDRDNDGWACER